ncbi:MAG: acyclic terpene utilization AtuA family protein [Sphingomonadales bacterium]|nr:acyclic terpene utilization AtuA family protein [Sphingomonadales bacterium]
MTRQRIVRIGGGTAFFDDSFYGHPALIAAGVDYIVYDYLAELTMASLSSDTVTNPDGFSPNFLRDITAHLPAILGSGAKIVTNWGGLNPDGAAAALRGALTALGIDARIGVVSGDDLRPRIDEMRARGVTEMFSGAPFPADRALSSMNAYFGAFPIAAALGAGADIVVTGRVVDSALALGPLIHEFGWGADDCDRLAAGTLVGHLVECSTQVTGGTFTDWEDVPDPAEIGNPIAECRADGSFVMTKPAGSGGLVSIGTVAEQMIYEVGDPQGYIVPDVVCDFSVATLTPDGPDRVLVQGMKGYSPTRDYKVCATWSEGWRAQVYQPIVGFNAMAKARRQAEALFTRTNAILRHRNLPPLSATHLEVIGAESSYGPRSQAMAAREVVAMMSADHDDADGVRVFLKEQVCAISAMAPGTAMGLGGNLGRGARPLMRVFLFLLPKAEFAPVVSVDGVAVRCDAAPSRVFAPAAVMRPPEPPRPGAAADMVEVPLIRLAWARSGDKGNLFNVGVFARRPAFWPWIAAALDAGAVAGWFAHLLDDPANPRVDRFLLPGSYGVNFLVHDALGGGGSQCARIDPLAKSMAQILLEYPVPVPRDLAG